MEINEKEQEILFLRLKMEMKEIRHELMIELKEMEARLMYAVRGRNDERQNSREENSNA